MLLDEFITKNSLGGALMPTAQTQGVVTALAAAPFQINPSEWLAIFWGVEIAPFNDNEQLEEFANIIATMWNQARQSLLTNTWQWPSACALSDAEIVNQATRNFCEGLLQGWQLTQDDWQTLLGDDEKNHSLVEGVLVSISLLFDPESLLASAEHEVDYAQFKEIFEAMPMLLAGITMKGAELASQ